ncbi:MAG: hypothetical protein GY811_23740 [Myxococcales bacterium]|nr:hypothetical protein [Myxococcales bacterium]
MTSDKTLISGGHSSDPWCSDFAAVRETTVLNVPSRHEARAQVLRAVEDKVQHRGFFAARFAGRPILMAAVIALVLLVLAPVSYALVTRLLFMFDTNQTEETIQHEVREQLKSAGVVKPTVDVDKSDDSTKVVISGGGQPLPDPDVRASTDGKPVESKVVVRIGVMPSLKLSPEEITSLQEIAKNADPKLFVRTDGMSDEDYSGLFIDYAAKHGFEAEVILMDTNVTILLKSRL